MASDGLGPDGIEVDGVMPWPSDPMSCKQKNADVLAPIAFSVGKTFLKKIFGKWCNECNECCFY